MSGQQRVQPSTLVHTHQNTQNSCLSYPCQIAKLKACDYGTRASSAAHPIRRETKNLHGQLRNGVPAACLLGGGNSLRQEKNSTFPRYRS
jgi:hypothetical protein